MGIFGTQLDSVSTLGSVVKTALTANFCWKPPLGVNWTEKTARKKPTKCNVPGKSPTFGTLKWWSRSLGASLVGSSRGWIKLSGRWWEAGNLGLVKKAWLIFDGNTTNDVENDKQKFATKKFENPAKYRENTKIWRILTSTPNLTKKDAIALSACICFKKTSNCESEPAHWDSYFSTVLL